MHSHEQSLKFQALKKQFHKGLSDRLNLIKKANFSDDAYALLHRLEGAAGLYDEHELCELSKVASQCLLKGDSHAYAENILQMTDVIDRIVGSENF